MSDTTQTPTKPMTDNSDVDTKNTEDKSHEDFNPNTVPKEFLYRHQYNYFKEKWATDAEYREKKKTARRKWHQTKMEDPEYAEKVRQYARRYYQKRKEGASASKE